MPLLLPLLSARVSAMCALPFALAIVGARGVPPISMGTYEGTNHRYSCTERGQKEGHDALSCAPHNFSATTIALLTVISNVTSTLSSARRRRSAPPTPLDWHCNVLCGPKPVT